MRDLKAIRISRRRRVRFVRLILIVTATVGAAVAVVLLVLPGASPFRFRSPPSALPSSAKPPIAPPLMRVRVNAIELDGVFLASTDGVDRVQRIDPLYQALKNRRNEEFQLPSDGGPRRVLLSVDSDVPAVVVKSIYQTAAFAGYKVAFLVADGGMIEP
jgi:hypothetical protein